MSFISRRNNCSGLMIGRMPALCVLLLWAPVLFFSCDQDPVFLGIANEEAPIDPRISGTPTKMVLFTGSNGPKMYVASHGSSTVYYYDTNKDQGRWQPTEPGVSVMDLAATDNYLYALGNSGKILQTDNAKVWSVVTDTLGSYQPVSIYGAGNYLFVGGYRDNQGTEEYAVYYLDENTTGLTLLKTDSGQLSGAVNAGSDYYFSTSQGIFAMSAPNPNKPPYSGMVKGILRVGTKIVAVDRDRKLIYGLIDGEFKVREDLAASSEYFTGAMSCWENTDSTLHKYLLLLGVQGSGTSYTHGYRELKLDSNGELPLTGEGVLQGGLATPGENEDKEHTSVKDKYKYPSSIGARAVMSILQVPAEVDQKRTLFASTSNKGLWSYRNDLWNAEP